MIDSLCFIGEYPFRKLALSSLREVVGALVNLGFTRILTAHFSSLFYRNPWSANENLVSEKRRSSVGVKVDLIAGVNPEYAVTKRRVVDLKREFRGILASPIYHGFKASSSVAKKLVEAVAEADLALILFGYLEDPRELHRAYRFRYQLKLEDLKEFINFTRSLGYSRVALFSLPFSLVKELFREISEASIYVDVSSDSVYGPVYDYVKVLVENVGEDLVVFSSKAPLTYVKSLLFKVLYSDISERAKKKVLGENAVKLFSLA